MSQNPLTELTHQLVKHFAIYPAGIDTSCVMRYGELIRYHNENLLEGGDMSIAASNINWECFCQKHGLQLRMNIEQLLNDEKAKEDLLEQSKQWIFPLQGITKLRRERYGLHFHRAPIIANVLNAIFTNGENYGKHREPAGDGALLPSTIHLSLNNRFINQDEHNSKELHKFRAKQLYLILGRILEYSKWRVVQSDDVTDDTLRVCVDCNNVPRRPSVGQEDKKTVRVVCGPVLEPTTKTATSMTSGGYMALRSNDMLLIAMHRHGVRDCVKGKNFESLMQRLGHAAVIVDLFEVRHSTGATVVRSGLGSSKGANYILYNSARLETLLRTFQAQVNLGVYEPLPPLDKIDLSVLEDELDWQLIYGYLLTFPKVVESTLAQLEQGLCAVHSLVRYIVDLASLFSRYYRHKQILVQQRTNLMPVLYARIYLVKAVRQVLNSALALLGIEPVDYM
ncbi:PREDICTED: DALR anticodon-binding domain-containing protein 3 [Drosophila arizonae]|uniref:DALR anticodon-binding domain-containing protein 3 n=1 Tax=Drosophila arizonae TaxID=7263 RepID=A0ABM1PY15_DROAR|nr:PREDICTED: DALR anticodon-binding domain-containing protein 3 [Drosophila arizonae]